MKPTSIVHFNNAIKDLSVVDRQLKSAAKIIEEVAYALAGEVTTDKVTRLMLLAAEVERLSATLHHGKARPAPHGGPAS